MKREDDLSIHIFGKISVDMARQRISWIRATNNNIVNIRVFQQYLQAYIHDITVLQKVHLVQVIVTKGITDSVYRVA